MKSKRPQVKTSQNWSNPGVHSNFFCFILMIGFQAGGGGYSYVGSRHFLGFKILNFNIFFLFSENEYFWGHEKFLDIFSGSYQNWTSFKGYFYVF